MIHLTLDLVPMSTNRANMIVHPKGGRPMIMKTPEARDWMKRAVQQLQVQKMQQHIRTIEGPVAMSMDVYRAANSGDLSNYYKGVEDAIQASGILLNDKQIKEHRLCRCLVDKVRPRYEITLHLLPAQGILIPLSE